MNPTVLTSSAKEALRKTVRSMRGKLIDELTAEAEREYHLGVELAKTKLPEARRCRRQRLEAWLEERTRSTSDRGARGPSGETGKGASKTAAQALRARYLGEAAEEAAHTLLNRLVMVRMLEHHGVLSPKVLTGGARSPGYQKEFMGYAGPLAEGDTRGYLALLEVVFAELSLELPGLFGPVGLTPLFPIPAAMLRELVEALDDDALESAWGDDTTLGWVYQYWNDPQREALDEKIANGGKIAPHEIASKTQMFTERYMVEWLLHNSLGLTWLAICKKNGWRADAEDVLSVLDERRAAFRKKRDAGEVALDALMPIEGELESAWKYYVPQPLPPDAVEKAPPSIRELKLLDPACGSGHFLVIAFDLLARMHEEEARHRGEARSRADIAEEILAKNLFGVDIDERAIQIAAAALWLKAKLYAEGARLTTMNLVAPALRLGRLPKDDPALERLCGDLERGAGIPKELTHKLVAALAGVDHLGTLLRVDKAIEDALREAESDYEKKKGWQGDLLKGFAPEPVAASMELAKSQIVARLEAFLAQHSGSDDLGLRLDGEQLEAGVRFVRIVKEGTYDVVVGNPPYQGISKTTNFDYVVKQYPRGKADLYAAFLERGLELVREGGISALLTMRGWMFLGQFKELRMHLLSGASLWALVDLDSGAFEEVSAAQVVLSVAGTVFRRAASGRGALAMRPTPTSDRASTGMTDRKRAGLLAQVGRYEFDPKGFEVIEGEPIVYWWTKEFLRRYANAPKLGHVAPVRQGAATSDNVRFLRKSFELRSPSDSGWVPYIKGAQGCAWCDPADECVEWGRAGLQVRAYAQHLYASYTRSIKNEAWYFRRGIAFAAIGAAFSARLHTKPGVFDIMGQSVFPPADALSRVVCSMNSTVARSVLQSLNPTIHFQVGDVNRLPVFEIGKADAIVDAVIGAFSQHEAHREPSVEFHRPGASPWLYAQGWAQRSVDRPEGAPLPPYEPEYDPPAPAAHVSFAIGVALGRFGANGEGILDTASTDALPAGILFIGPGDRIPDSLDHAAAKRIEAAWEEHQAAILAGKRSPLRDYLRKDFFAYHKGLYENRPIYFPISSEKKTFVAWVSIHRFTDRTLPTLLADHVNPVLRQLDAEIADLNTARASSDKKTAQGADKQYGVAKKARDELADFAKAIAECAERGAPPTDAACPKRAADAPFHMDLDDGVMINSAALWPLLAPQWNDPKKWWKQLCLADGKKDYDWAHLARRYFPARVEEKCKVDPSLAVAHACFWKYHPAKAHAWELRLQHEIRPEFTIDEPESNACRARFLSEHAGEAEAIRQKEMLRRERAAAKRDAEDDDGRANEDVDSAETEDA